MNEIISFPKLQAEDIEVKKGGKINDDLNFYLLYQNARTTMKLLDETFGTMGWQIEYSSVGNTIYGNLSVYDVENKQWITKSDTGEFSTVAENKGLSSDILKRCAVRLGIGRELYSAPTIILPKSTPKNLKVSKIVYSGDVISVLELVDEKGNLVYTYPNNGEYANVPTTTNKVNTEQKNLSVEDVIKEVRDKANTMYSTIEDNNKAEFKNCINYYIKKIENGKWQGGLDINKVWQKWINNSYRKAS